MSEDQKAGTISQDGADAAVNPVASGTPDETGRDAGTQDEGEKRTDWKALALTYKGKAERLNDLEREKAELEERLRATETSPTGASQTNEEAVSGELQAEYIELVQRAQGGDVLAKRELRRWEEDIIRQRELADELYLARLRDPDHEMELRKFYKSNRSHFNSIAAADDALAGRKARQSQSELAKERERLEREARAREEGVVATHHVEVPASEAKARKMSEAQFNDKLKELEAAGKTGEAMQLARKARRGEIVVT